MKTKDYYWCLTVKNGTNLDFIFAETVKENNIVAACMTKDTKASIWTEGKTETEAVASLKVKLEEKFGKIQRWNDIMFEVSIFDKDGKHKDIAPGPIWWTGRNGYSPQDGRRLTHD
jgi:hypothetical protein